MKRGWLIPAAAGVVAVTLWRVVLMWLDPVDATAGEAAVWAGTPWLGRIGAPPLTGWVLALFGGLGESHAWLRLPGPLFHAAAALLLGRLANRLFGRRVAVLTALGWVTLPAVSVAATGTSPGAVTAPLLVLALGLYVRLLDARTDRLAVAAGLMLGLAGLASYWALLAVAGAVLAGRVFAEARPSRRQGAILLGAAALVLAPHLVAGLVAGGMAWPVRGAWGGWAAALAVVLGAGPMVLALIAGAERTSNPVIQFLLLFMAPVAAFAFVTAPFGVGGGGWVAAWLAGLPVAMAWLSRRRRWLWGCFAVNGAVALLVPLALLAPERAGLRALPWVAARVGHAEMSQTVLDIARDLRIGTVVAADPALRADLALAARDGAVAVTGPDGAIPEARDVLLALPRGAEAPCPAEVMEVADMAPEHGAFAGAPQALFLVPGVCLQ